MENSQIEFQSNLPYPKVEVKCKNIAYARAMLDNVGGCNSEITAVTSYFYNDLITANKNKEVANIFHKISIVEMRHLDIFGELARQLGEDPRLWSYKGWQKIYWTPGYINYSTNIVDILKNAIRIEKRTIEKYNGQANMIEDENIVAILKRIIIDEEKHVKIFSDLLKKFN